MKITPFGKQVLIEPDEDQSNISEHGIVTPDNVEEETKGFGTVRAIGPDVENIKVGMHVIYGIFAGDEISFKESSKQVDRILMPSKMVLAGIDLSE